ncbi:hypothetical protein EB155_13510, partial [archaeon]|nr:hypothetical protein [archaeon]NDB80871.1 hypothetical protein [archaeon]
HAYPELVEKHNGKIVAEMRATLFKGDFSNVNNRFLEILKEPIKDGITTLIYVNIQFHPIFGLSFNIKDVDPVFTLGELEKEKFETIEKLKKLNLFDLNKSLKPPILFRNIAVISAETSKGFSDFISVLTSHNKGYKFGIMVFNAVLQGDSAIKSILDQLDKIEKVIHHFDAVAIIRGGGGEVGMTCYNDFNLSKRIAEFPIPVLTGIGHSTNYTVVEMISYQNGITPTELATFIVNRFEDFETPVDYYSSQIAKMSRRLLGQNRLSFNNTLNLLKIFTRSILNDYTQQQQNILEKLDILSEKSLNLNSRSIQLLSEDLKFFVKSIHRIETNKLISAVEGLELNFTRNISFQTNNLQHQEKLIGVMNPQR